MQEQTKEESTSLAILNYKDLPAYTDAKAKQERLVIENPFVEISDTESFNLAKQRRTALLKGRTELQSGEKVIVKKVSAFRKEVGEETDKLISITKPHEDKQQKEIDRYEAERQRLREEVRQKKLQRIEGIKNSIKAFKTDIQNNISKADIQTIYSIKENIDSKEMDCQEFDQEFDIIKEQLREAYFLKLNQIEKDEQRRKDQVKLDEQKAIMDLEKKRFKELKSIVFVYEGDDLGTMPEDTYKKLYDQAKAESDLIEAQRLAEENATKAKVRMGEERRQLLSDIDCEVDANTCSGMIDEVWEVFYKTKKEAYDQELQKIKEKTEREVKEKAKELERRIDALVALGYKYDIRELCLSYSKLNIKVKEFSQIPIENFDNNFLPECKTIIEKEDKRLESLKPDKDRLEALVKSMPIIVALELNTQEAQKLHDSFFKDYQKLIDKYALEIETLK